MVRVAYLCSMGMLQPQLDIVISDVDLAAERVPGFYHTDIKLVLMPPTNTLHHKNTRILCRTLELKILFGYFHVPHDSNRSFKDHRRNLIQGLIHESPPPVQIMPQFQNAQ